MHISFRQGLVRAPNGFLTLSAGTVALNGTVSDPVVFAVADGSSDYLVTERSTASPAWTGPFVSGSQNYYLYVDLDQRTGVRTFGHTLYEPVEAANPPLSPADDQHWFDTANAKMMVWKASASRWIPKIRVFAAMLQSGTVFVSMSAQSPAFTGTQVGLTPIGGVDIGSIVFDGDGFPLKRADGTFFTTEDQALTGIGSSTQVKFASIVVEGEAQANLPAYTMVRFVDFGKVDVANTLVVGEGTYGIVEHSASAGSMVNVTMEGVVNNPDWAWETINAPVYVDESGALTTTPPSPAIAVGVVISPTQVLLRQAAVVDTGSGGGGGGGSVSPATTLTLGTVRLSTAAAVSGSPIVVGDNDSRIQAVANKLDRSGGTMTGLLTLSGAPSTSLHASTKGYVDSTLAAHAGTGGSAHSAATTSNAGFMTAADKLKLDGIAAGATVNSSDATLLARANHTGTQPASSISDLTEVTQDTAAAMFTGGTHTGITFTYDDTNGVVNAVVSGGGGGGGNTNLTTTVSPTTNVINSDTGTDATLVAADATNAGLFLPAEKTKLAGIATGATANSSDATLLARANHTGTQALSTISDVTITAVNLNTLDDGADTPLHFHTADRARSNHTGTQLASTISDFAEAVDDRVGAFLVAGANVTLNYNDAANTLTISSAGGGGGGTIADGSYGDVTVSSAGTVITVNTGAVTNAKMANVATATLKGRATAGTGAPEDLSATQVRTLLNVADGATANSADVVLLSRANHTGTQTASTISDFSTAADARITAATGVSIAAFGHTHSNVVAAGASGFMTGADKTKLDGIATGATANSSDATLLSRTNHTGTQLASTISDFSEAVDDRVSTLLVAGSGISLSYNDAANTLTVTNSASGQASIQFQDEGSNLGTSGTVTAFNVTGAGATMTRNTNTITLDVPAASVPDATSGVTGGVRLTGALGGTATAPTALGYANAAALASDLALKAPLTTVVETVATGSPYTLVSADNGKIKRFVDTNPQTCNITTAVSGLGFVLEWPASSGVVTLDAGTGVNLNGLGDGVNITLSNAGGAVQIIPTGTNTWDVVGSIGDLVATDITDSTSLGRSLLLAADITAARTALSLVPGTNVQAYDAKLAAIAGLTGAADTLAYFTGATTATTTTLTSGGRALINSAGTANTFPYFSASNTVTLGAISSGGLALLNNAGTSGTFPYYSASNTITLGTITAAGRALIDDADTTAQLTTLGLSADARAFVTAANYAAMRTAIGLTIGTNVQAFDAYLQKLSAATPRALTGATSLIASDVDCTIRANSGSTFAITVPNDATLLPVSGKSVITVFIQGAGVPTFTAGSGATILGTPPAGLAQNNLLVLVHTGIADTWAYA